MPSQHMRNSKWRQGQHSVTIWALQAPGCHLRQGRQNDIHRQLDLGQVQCVDGVDWLHVVGSKPSWTCRRAHSRLRHGGPLGGRARTRLRLPRSPCRGSLLRGDESRRHCQEFGRRSFGESTSWRLSAGAGVRSYQTRSSVKMLHAVAKLAMRRPGVTMLLHDVDWLLQIVIRRDVH